MLPEIERFQKWLRRKYPRTSTPIHYVNDLVLFFAWSTLPVREINLRTVDAFIEHCQSIGHSNTTINRRLAAIRTFYTFLELESDDAIPNPVIPKRHFIRVGVRLPRDVEDKELDKLFKTITSIRDIAIFTLMLRCGLRVGEIRNLTINDLFLNPNSGSLPRLWLHGKGGGERVAYLSAQAFAALRAWLIIRPVSEDSSVFLNRFGRKLTVTGIQSRLAVYCREAQTWITCHQFRHTFGRHLAEARIPVTSIQRLLGHSRIRTSEIYIHISDTQVQADYDAAMSSVSFRSLQTGGAA
jgi:site-specific recombinase XerD